VVANVDPQQLHVVAMNNKASPLEERCRNQFRAMCADIKEVKTKNSEGSAKQEDESSHPLA
jgi:hypothetical protein